MRGYSPQPKNLSSHLVWTSDGDTSKRPPPPYNARLGTFNWTETFCERPRASSQATLVPSAPGRPYPSFSSRSWKASLVTRILDSSLFSLLPLQNPLKTKQASRGKQCNWGWVMEILISHEIREMTPSAPDTLGTEGQMLRSKGYRIGARIRWQLTSGEGGLVRSSSRITVKEQETFPYCWETQV